MKILRDGEKLSVSEIPELDAASSGSFRSQLSAALPANVRQIDIDLSRTRMDCSGVGALVALRNWAREQNLDVAIRLLNPTQAVRRLFFLTRLDRLFPIEHQ
jgi:anti-anti-sigma factor